MAANLTLMLADLQLFPPAASAQAGPIDDLYWFEIIVSVIMTVLIFVAVIFWPGNTAGARTCGPRRSKAPPCWS